MKALEKLKVERNCDTAIAEPPKPESPAITPEQAAAVLNEEFAKKQQACMAELAAVLNKYGFEVFVPQPQAIIRPRQQ